MTGTPGFGLVTAVFAIGAVVATQFSSSIEEHLAGARLGPPARAAAAQAERLTLGRPSVAGVPPRQARIVIRAADDASLASFRIGIEIAGVLVLLGGLIGAAGIQNPLREVSAEECPGGQLVGASPDAAGCHEESLPRRALA